MRPTIPAQSPEREFPYGWRYVRVARPDGSEDYEQIALTLEDTLHPQEGDVIPESIAHDADCTYLATVLRSRPLGPARVLVSHDLLVDWGVEGVRNHSPDVAVFVGLSRDPDPGTGVLELTELGGRCELVIEVVSPNRRENDVVHKFGHYFRVGIPVYVLIDQPKEDGPRFLRAYKRKADRYAEIESDDQNRVDLPSLGIMLGMRADRVVCYDLRTHRELGDYSQITRALEEAERDREKFDQAREQLEQAMEEQVTARQQAERLVANVQKEADHERQEKERIQKEADQVRQEKERIQKDADRQREEADRQRKAREELEAQKLRAEEDAAKQIRDLQEMGRQLQASATGTPPSDQ